MKLALVFACGLVVFGCGTRHWQRRYKELFRIGPPAEVHFNFCDTCRIQDSRSPGCQAWCANAQ